jgi:hypothetical protein
MRWLAWAMFAAGCGGGADSETDASTDVTDTETSPTIEPLCDIPQYDLGSMTCSQLATALDNQVNAGNRCSVKEDCVILRAECEHWQQTGCWYAANRECVGLAVEGKIDVAAFNAAAANCNGTQGCSCGGTPDVDCIAGRCAPI